MFTIAQTPLGEYLVCPRRRCGQLNYCRYEHNCKAVTREERLRDNRNSRIGTMLEAHGLSLYDLELFIKETMKD